MKHRIAVGTVSLSLALSTGLAALQGQPPAPKPAAPPGDATATPAQLFNQARDHIREGRFDTAAEVLKRFLAFPPTGPDYLALTAREPTAFQKLRNVPVWSDNPTAQADAVRTVDLIIKQSEEANRAQLQNPERVAKFVRNLGETEGERLYAVEQLRLAGDAAVAPLVDALRTSADATQRSGILNAIQAMNPDQVPGFLAATDGLPTELKLAVLQAILRRGDAVQLVSSPETDYTPHLWYYSAATGEEVRTLRNFALAALDQLTGGTAAKRSASVELTKIAQPFVDRTARFKGGNAVKLWSFDPAKLAVTSVPATASQAGYFFGVRDLRWALERNPNDAAAQEQFLALVIDRGVEKAAFGNLFEAEPTLVPVLAAAPSDLLSGMLDRAMDAKKTTLALGLVQVLSSRGDRAVSTAGRPTVLVKALDYPDARVQLAAALGVLRAPNPSSATRPARIVEILRRAAAVEAPPAGAAETGRALIADPSDFRADRTAALLKQLGYRAERFRTGRDLVKRLAAASDADLVIVDRHIGNPDVRDLLSVLSSDTNALRRPILVVASSDAPKPVSFELLLVRLAVLIAVTETADIAVPPPYAYDVTRPVQNFELERQQVARTRDRRLSDLFDLRTARMRRLLDGSGLPQSEPLRVRLTTRVPQLTYAALAAQYPVTRESSPDAFRQFDAGNRLMQANRGLNALAGVRTEGLSRLIEELQGTLDAPRLATAEAMLARMDREALSLPVDQVTDPVLEDQLRRMVRNIPSARVIGEAIAAEGFREDVYAAVADPAAMPTSAAVKRQSARLAVDALRRMAIGELAGFDVRPAEAALRQALRSDDLADLALDAVARIPTAEAQQDLIGVALGIARPLPIRVKAADRAIQHVQAFGKLTPVNQLDALTKSTAAETVPELKVQFTVLRQLLVANPERLGEAIPKFPLPLPGAPVVPAKPPEQKPAEPKGDEKPPQ